MPRCEPSHEGRPSTRTDCATSATSRCGYNGTLLHRPRVVVVRPADSRAHAVAPTEEPQRPSTNASRRRPRASPFRLRTRTAKRSSSSPPRLPFAYWAISSRRCPARGFRRASPTSWTADRLVLARGAGGLDHGELVVIGGRRGRHDADHGRHGFSIGRLSRDRVGRDRNCRARRPRGWYGATITLPRKSTRRRLR